MLRGLPFVYQGQELGMENVDFKSIDEIDDISTLDEYQVAKNAGLSDQDALDVVKYYSRDNARTPFQWDDSENAGFTTGTPWLPLNPNYKRINAKSQVGDENSVFSYYKKLTALRKNPEYKDVVVYGTFEPFMEDTSRLMAFYRRGIDKTLLVLGNFQNEERIVALPADCKKVVLNNYDSVEINQQNEITLAGYQAVILEI